MRQLKERRKKSPRQLPPSWDSRKASSGFVSFLGDSDSDKTGSLSVTLAAILLLGDDCDANDGSFNVFSLFGICFPSSIDFLRSCVTLFLPSALTSWEAESFDTDNIAAS